jgi:hypothetical protein
MLAGTLLLLLLKRVEKRDAEAIVASPQACTPG